MAAGNILQAAVFNGGVIEGDPARQVGHRFRPCPVGVVLVPGYAAAAGGRLDEELVMEETDRSSQQLVGGKAQPGVPEQVMKGGFDLPGAKGMEENPAFLFGFVEMEFIKEGITRMGRIEEPVEFFFQLLQLGGFQEPDAAEKAVLFEAVNLLLCERIGHPLPG